MQVIEIHDNKRGTVKITAVWNGLTVDQSYKDGVPTSGTFKEGSKSYNTLVALLKPIFLDYAAGKLK